MPHPTNPLKPTPGTITGTKIIVFSGGPPGWEGSVDAVLKEAVACERWDYVADAAIIFRRTECTEEIPIEREKRTGTITEMKTAEVFAYAGYKDDLIEAGDFDTTPILPQKKSKSKS